MGREIPIKLKCLCPLAAGQHASNILDESKDEDILF